MEGIDRSREIGAVPSPSESEAERAATSVTSPERSKADKRALLTELSMLNKQIAALAWNLVDTDPTSEEQLSLADRMETVGKMIRIRVERSQNTQPPPGAGK